VDELLRALQTRRPVVIDPRDDYVTVRLPAGAIALFASADKVAIAVDPMRGYTLVDRPAFRCQIPRTPVTSYVVVQAQDLAPQFDEVLGLAIESLDWRAGPRDALWCARCGVGCATKRDACPKCWAEIDDDGECLCTSPAVGVLAS
jgi:hypothetical protein